MGKDTGKQLETLLISYIKALTSNIKDRLGNSPKVIEAYAIFHPLLLPSSDDDSFKEYGDAEVRIIADHFFPGNQKTRKESCLASGPKLSILFLERSSKYQMKVIVVPPLCPSC